MTDSKPVLDPIGTLVHGFRLGDEVKDIFNDIKGRAVERHYHMTGCDRFAVEPAPTDGKPGETFVVTNERLKRVKEHTKYHRDEAPDLHVKLGDKVTSQTMGISGIATVIVVPLFGSVRVCIEPQWDAKTKKMPEPFLCDVAFVKVDEAYDGRSLTEQKPKPTAKREPGNSRLPTRKSPLR